MSVDAVLRLLLEDKASAGVTAFSSTVTAACATASLAWGAFSGTMSAAMGVAQAVGGSLSALGSVVVESGQKMFELSQQSSVAINSLNDMAQSVGVAVGELQVFAEAGADIGISAGEMSQAFRFLQVNIQQAVTGNKGAVESFNKLGVSFVDEVGKARAASDVMRDLSGAMVGMADGSQKTATAIDFFGRSGARMIPLLNNLEGGLKGADAQLKALGKSITSEGIAAAQRFSASLDDLGDSVEALQTYFGTSMMGVFADAMGKVGAAIQETFQKMTPQIAAVSAAIKIGLLDLLDKIPFEAISQKVQALASMASNLIVTRIGVAIRAIDAIPWSEIGAKGTSVLTSLSAFAAKAWDLLATMAAAGYRSAWNAVQEFGPMMVQVTAKSISGIVELVHYVADSWKVVTHSIVAIGAALAPVYDFIKGMILPVISKFVELVVTGVEDIRKVVGIAADLAAKLYVNLERLTGSAAQTGKSFVAIGDAIAPIGSGLVEAIKPILQMKSETADYFTTLQKQMMERDKQDADWWQATQSRANGYARQVISMEGDIRNAIGQTRNMSDQVVEAIAKAARETNNLTGQTALSVNQAAALKSNFYMAGENAEVLQGVAARLGVSLGALAETSKELADNASQATRAMETADKSARALRAFRAAEDAAKAKELADYARQAAEATEKTANSTVTWQSVQAAEEEAAKAKGMFVGEAATALTWQDARAAEEAVAKAKEAESAKRVMGGSTSVTTSPTLGTVTSVTTSPLTTGSVASVTTPTSKVGSVVSGDTTTMTYIGGLTGGGSFSSGGEWWRTTTAASPAASSGPGAGYAVNTSHFMAPAIGGGAPGPVSIGTFGQNNSIGMMQTDPQPADVNIDGEKLGRLMFKRYAAGAWNMPKSAVKDSR